MSWKSLVSAGLLCVVASPVFAVPNLTVSTAPTLNANGDWIWNAVITPTTTTSPIAGELGFRETVAGSQLISASKGAAFTGASTDNPGSDIFGTAVSGDWEIYTDQGGGNMKPAGLQTNVPTDEVFAALGSIADVTGAEQYVQIITAGPLDTRLTTSLQVLGGYSGNGRLAELTSPTTSSNYSNFAGTATRTVVIGDLNLSGVAGGGAAVTIADFSTLVTSLNKTLGPRNWTQGDLNGTTGGAEVTISDFSLLVSCLNKTTGACALSANTPLSVNGVAGGAGSSLGGGSAVPEPASVALAGLAMLGVFGVIRRRRVG